MKNLILMSVIAVMAVLPVSAQSLKERDIIARDKVALADYANRVNSTCGGTHIQFTIDYNSFTTNGGVTDGQNSPHFLAMNAGDAIMNISKTEAGKQAIREKIKEVHTVYTDGEEESLSNGVFTYKIGYKGGNVTNPENWLKAHL